MDLRMGKKVTQRSWLSGAEWHSEHYVEQWFSLLFYGFFSRQAFALGLFTLQILSNYLSCCFIAAASHVLCLNGDCVLAQPNTLYENANINPFDSTRTNPLKSTRVSARERKSKRTRERRIFAWKWTKTKEKNSHLLVPNVSEVVIAAACKNR